MANNFNMRKAQTTTKEILSTFFDEKERITEVDYQKQLQELQPGSVLPARKIRTTQGRESLRNAYTQSREALQEAIASAKASEGLTKAPSDEALRILNLLSMRTTIDQDEFNQLSEKYGETYLASKAFGEIAAKHKLNHKAHGSAANLQTLDAVEQRAMKSLDNTFRGLNAFSDNTSKTIAINAVDEIFQALETGGDSFLPGGGDSLLTGLGLTGSQE